MLIARPSLRACCTISCTSCIDPGVTIRLTRVSFNLECTSLTICPDFDAWFCGSAGIAKVKRKETRVSFKKILFISAPCFLKRFSGKKDRSAKYHEKANRLNKMVGRVVIEVGGMQR